MNSIVKIIISLVLMVNLTICNSQTNLTALNIIEKSIENSKIDGLEAVSTLIIIDKNGNERIRETTMASKIYDNGNVEKRIIKFLSPADVKGTGMLIFDFKDKNDDMWLYLPAIRKTRRIVSSEKSKNFMGSEFTNADMSAPLINDFKYNLIGEKLVDNTLCYELESVPVNEDIADEYGFSRKIQYIGKADFVIRKSVTYDYDDELLKTMEVLKIKEIIPSKNKSMATYLQIVNHQNNRKSIMNMEQVQYNQNVKDEYFTVSFLEN